MGTKTSLSARIFENHLLRYGYAIASGLVASLTCSRLNPVAGDAPCYVLLLLAVAFSAWYCGVGPAIAVILISLAGITFGFIPRVHPFSYLTQAQLVSTLAFLLASVLVVWMAKSRQRQNEELLRAQSELEDRVRERTSDLDAVNRNLRELSARLLQLQDDERRRIARELHDSVGQTLAALGMNLSMVRGDIEKLAGISAALSDSENLVREMGSEVRTISHLLHPPLLDEAGLFSALRWYVDGFAQRSRIKVDLDLPEDFGRLPSEMETAIFRMVQECLTNIHRHSESSIAKIRLRHRHDEIVVEIEDKGKGVSPEKLQDMASAGTPGVGIRGMRERFRQLGGTLDIVSSSAGTIVTVRLPIAEKASQALSMVDPAAAA